MLAPFYPCCLLPVPSSVLRPPSCLVPHASLAPLPSSCILPLANYLLLLRLIATFILLCLLLLLLLLLIRRPSPPSPHYLCYHGILSYFTARRVNGHALLCYIILYNVIFRFNSLFYGFNLLWKASIVGRKLLQTIKWQFLKCQLTTRPIYRE